MIMMLLLAFVVIPDQTGTLISLVSSKSKYQRRSYKATSDISYVVVIGYVSDNAMFHFFQEYFHEDHGE